MKYTYKRITFFILFTLFLTTSHAKGLVDFGYANADINGTKQSGFSLGYGANFGETYKHSIGFKVLFLGDGNSASEDKGNIGDIYYNLGYQLFPYVIGYGSIGYGFQSLGRVSNTSVYASGISIGGGLQYFIKNNITLDCSYKNYSLQFDNLSYNAKVANINLVYTFGK